MKMSLSRKKKLWECSEGSWRANDSHSISRVNRTWIEAVSVWPSNCIHLYKPHLENKMRSPQGRSQLRGAQRLSHLRISAHITSFDSSRHFNTFDYWVFLFGCERTSVRLQTEKERADNAKNIRKEQAGGTWDLDIIGGKEVGGPKGAVLQSEVDDLKTKSSEESKASSVASHHLNLHSHWIS